MKYWPRSVSPAVARNRRDWRYIEQRHAEAAQTDGGGGLNKGLDSELQHVAYEAARLARSAAEPDYVEILVREALRLREEAAAAAAVPTEKMAPPPAQPRPQPVAVTSTQEYELVWHDVAAPAETDGKVEQPNELDDTGGFCPGPSWAGDPEEYQEQAALTAVAAGLTVMPWCWVEITCGSTSCLDVKHMIFRSPQRLLYPASVCVYCGEYADSRDHLLPVTYTGKAVRRHVLTVPACRQCNSFIGDASAPSVTERRAIAHSSLRRKRFRVLQSFDYTDDELEDFGHSMRSSVLRAREEKGRLLRRLAFPGDDTYDLEYLALSGIDDPYALGLLKTDDRARSRRR